MAYAYSENFILPISHDEVVHGKGSMFERAPQDEWRKFATLRAFYAFMWSHPGKKLLFMGTEFGQRREFSEHRSLDWEQTAEWGHRGVQRLVKDLNAGLQGHTRRCGSWTPTRPASRWINADDSGGNVFSFLRFDGEGQMIACVTNFSSEPRPDYRIGLPAEGVWTEILNTDAEVYDGTGQIGNLGQVVAPRRCPRTAIRPRRQVTIPPLGAVWLRFESAVPTEEHERAGEGRRPASGRPPRRRSPAAEASRGRPPLPTAGSEAAGSGQGHRHARREDGLTARTTEKTARWPTSRSGSRPVEGGTAVLDWSGTDAAGRR